MTFLNYLVGLIGYFTSIIILILLLILLCLISYSFVIAGTLPESLKTYPCTVNNLKNILSIKKVITRPIVAAKCDNSEIQIEKKSDIKIPNDDNSPCTVVVHNKTYELSIKKSSMAEINNLNEKDYYKKIIKNIYNNTEFYPRKISKLNKASSKALRVFCHIFTFIFSVGALIAVICLLLLLFPFI